MGKLTFVQKILSSLNKNSPTILTGVSVAGLLTTVIFAVRATPKAMDLIYNEQLYRSHKGDNKQILKKDIFLLTWKEYVPAAIMGTVTIVCIIGANSINLRRNAALVGLYSLTETTLKEYKHKIVEVLGEKKAQKVTDDIAQDTVARHPVREVIVTGKGDTLCFEVLSARYFRSNIEAIRKVQNDINQQLLNDNYVSLNELYDALDLAHTKIGNDIGWRIYDGQVEFRFSSTLTSDGTPCLVLDYVGDPNYAYQETH